MIQGTRDFARFRSIAFFLISAAFLAIALIFFTMKDWGKFTDLPWQLRLCGYFFGLGFLRASVKLFVRGRRIAAPTANEVLVEDARAPILYLRSFTTDSHELSAGPKHGFMRAFPDERFEELLVLMFERLGPVIAIADPKASLTDLGAARFHSSDGDWQQKILAQLSQSQLVLIATGSSPGLVWEIEETIKTVLPTRILFVFTEFNERETGRKSLAFQTFRDAIGPLLPRGLPNDIGDAIFIRFSSDWEPILVGSPAETPLFYRLQSASLEAFKATSPAFKVEFESIAKQSNSKQYRMLVAAIPRRRWVTGGTILAILIVLSGIYVWFVSKNAFPAQAPFLALGAMFLAAIFLAAIFTLILREMRLRMFES